RPRACQSGPDLLTLLTQARKIQTALQSGAFADQASAFTLSCCSRIQILADHAWQLDPKASI
ncbi:MAG: hypothetical protein VW687_04190, partial [Curvibacter sp.]